MPITTLLDELTETTVALPTLTSRYRQRYLFYATGKRIRELPIHLDMLVS